MSRTRIFAYGSNMHPARMLERVPGAVAHGPARLAGHRLVLNKRGRDGSAKANLEPHPEGLVWGVVWELSPEEARELDRHEGGYERITVSVEVEAGSEGATLEVEAYVSRRLHDDDVAYDWYLDHLVCGARAHGFPDDYVAWLESLPSRTQDGDG